MLISRLARIIESPPAMLKSYLWVADPRQVTFLCLSKEKSPKEKTPRSARRLRRFPPFLAPPGARQLAGRIQRASGSNTGSLKSSRWGCGTRRALRGSEKTCCSIPPSGMARVGVFKTPYGAPEPRKALGKRPEGVAHRDVRDWPTRQDASLGQRRDPKLRRRGSVRRPGGLFFRGFLLAEQKKATQGAGVEPPAIMLLNRGCRPLDQRLSLDTQ